MTHLVDTSPQFASATVAPVSWLSDLLAGPLGTALAVVAIAWFGLGMLSGRASPQRFGLTVLGCALLFGASMIARSLLGAVRPSSVQISKLSVPQPVPTPAAPPTPPQYDPYAGASVPNSGTN